MRTAIAVLAVVLVTAGCTSESGDDDRSTGPVAGTADDSSQPSTGVGGDVDNDYDVDIPAGAFDGEREVTVEPGDEPPPEAWGTSARGPAVEISAGGAQPEVPLTVSLPLPADVDVPDLAFLARWDPDDELWYPLPTTYHADTNELRAEIDHLSLFAPFEWVGGRIADGVEWTGRQLKNLFDTVVDGFEVAIEELADFADLIGTNVAGWLAIRGAPPPDCSGPAGELGGQSYELINSADGDQPPLFGCVELDEQSGAITVKVANNRPYGMVIDLAPTASIEPETWPGFGLDSGQAGMLAFYSILDETLDLRQAWVPPGATMLYRIDEADLDADGLEILATSTSAYVGVDLAVELVKALWTENAEDGVKAINCLLVGGSDFLEIVQRFDGGGVLAYLQSFTSCALSFLSDRLSDLLSVAQATAATIPALLSNIRDVGGTGAVENSLTLLPVTEAPAGAVVEFASTFDGGSSDLYRSDGSGFELVGTVTAAQGSVQLTDIAASSSGAVYGVSFDQLYSIDPETSRATLIAGLPSSDTNALDVGPGGQLIAADRSGVVWTIDPQTGNGSEVARFPAGLVSSGDLVVLDDGTVYATAAGGPGEVLVVLDLNRGTALQAFGLPDAVYGLLVRGGKLIGLTNTSSSGRCTMGEVLAIDPQQATYKESGCLDFRAGGAANG